MAAILAAFDNVTSAAYTLANLTDSPFAELLQRPKTGQLRLLAFSASDQEVERMRAAYPTFKTRRTKRLLDNLEGGVRGGLLGLITGTVIIQIIGYGVYVLGNERPAEMAAAAGLNTSSAGALIALFLGFFGALVGGMVGYILGRKWLGLPPELARRYEQRLQQGELLLAVNQRRLLWDRTRRLKIQSGERGGSASGFSLEKFYFWLGEHGAHATLRVPGSVTAISVTNSPYNI